VPGTSAEDGDPLDVLLLIDEPAFPGCVVRARLIGVLQAEQRERGKAVRNDRLIAVACESHDHSELQSLRDLEAHLLEEIEHFFVSYHEATKKPFRVLGYRGRKVAEKALAEAVRR
jgi:inorganic pyrophosphatase